MNTKFFSLLLSLLFCCAVAHAQEAQKSALQQRAEADNEKGDIASARFHFIRAFEDYAGKGQIRQGVECGTKATALYYKENYYKEAFDLLQRIEQAIQSKEQDGSKKAALK